VHAFSFSTVTQKGKLDLWKKEKKRAQRSKTADDVRLPTGDERHALRKPCGVSV
jgi:hypothetical protein